MLRATHFVLLFVVLVCGYSVRADEGPDVAPDLGPPPDQPIPVPESVILPDNSDLDTDATSYWGYYRPSWHYGWGKGWRGRGWGWGGRWGGHWRSHWWY